MTHAFPTRRSSDLPRHGGDHSSQEGPAVGCLGPCLLVLRRHAAHCIGDTAVDQAEPIARMAAIAALGEAELQEGAIEQVAGVVPGEGAARLVGALQPRRQTDHQRSEEHTSELQSLMRISYAVFCLKKKN